MALAVMIWGVGWGSGPEFKRRYPERIVRDDEVGGSNLPTPTRFHEPLRFFPHEELVVTTWGFWIEGCRPLT